jgi:hypothetical protein
VRPFYCSLLWGFALVRSLGCEPCIAEFPMEFREGMLWVQVRAPETQRKLDFLLDSGAEVSVIDSKTAKEMGLAFGARVGVRGIHVSTDGYWCATQAADANGAVLPHHFLALDLTKLSGSCGHKVDGLIGADFFKNKIVQIDFRREKVRLLTAETIDSLGGGVPLEVRRCGMRVMASVDGQKRRWLRVDTGCASALQWVTGRVSAQECATKVAVGLAEVGIPQTRTIVQIGHETLRNVETGLHSSEIFPGESGLIGNGLLGQFEQVTIDAAGGKLILGPRRTLAGKQSQ